MLLDNQNLFSDNQKITSGTQDSQNIVRFGKGDISYLPLLVQVTNDFKDLTSLTIKILTSETQDFANSEILVESTLQKAKLTTGAKFPIANMPKGNKGYIKLAYTTEGATETTGTITAGIVLNNDITFEG